MAGQSDTERHDLVVAVDLKSAITHLQAGNLDQAEALFRKILTYIPEHPDALHMLGVIANRRGEFDRAVQLIGQALALAPRNVDAHVNLGNALRSTGRLAEGIASYRRAIALNPRMAIAHSNLGRMLNQVGDFEGARASCETAIQINPTLTAGHINLAIALRGLHRAREAAEAYRHAIRLQPQDASLYHDLGNVLTELQLLNEALKCHDQSIKLKPDEAIFHFDRGSVLLRQREIAAASESFRRAATLAPDSVGSWISLGWTLRLMGRFDESTECMRRAAALGPDTAETYRHLASAGGDAVDEAEIDRLVELIERPDANGDSRIVANFALGRLYDRSGRFDEAFKRFATGNALYREQLASRGLNFDAAQFAKRIDLLIANCTAEYFAAQRDAGISSEIPVFVVGMPRSGTTLVEQICASHSLVFGAGELSDIDELGTLLVHGAKTKPGVYVGEFDRARQLAEAHLGRLRRLGGNAVRVIDKMPDNVLHLGLIATLFPAARVIFCRRDERDICLSCYLQLFADGTLPFTYDLADCGRRYLGIERLVEHWQRVLPLRWHEVRYEALVANLEQESRRLIDFLGLEWEPACLEFHRTERVVTTASHWQVRQPLYTGSVGRWVHYEKQLEPLFETLRAGRAAGAGNPPPDRAPQSVRK